MTGSWMRTRSCTQTLHMLTSAVESHLQAAFVQQRGVSSGNELRGRTLHGRNGEDQT